MKHTKPSKVYRGESPHGEPSMIARVAARKLEGCRVELLALSHQHVEWLARFFEWQALGLVEETRWAKVNIRAIRSDISLTNRLAEFWRRLT